MIRAYRMLTTVGFLHPSISVRWLTLPQKMIEDLMADSKRWEEELRRSRNRGPRPGIH